MKNTNLIKAQQSGFTLVELLVGLVISLFISAVAMTYLVSSSRMLTIQNSEDLSQENARFAMEIMSSSARLAGSNLSTSPQSNVEGIFTGEVCSGNICNTDSLDYSSAGSSYDSDRVAFDYVTSSGTTCTGNPIVNERKIVTVFYVDDVDNDGIASLYCQAYESFLDPITQSYTTFTTPNNAVPLIDGVDALQVQYGVDSDQDGDIDTYTAFSNVDIGNEGDIAAGIPPDLGDIPFIYAVRFGILVSSGQGSNKEKSTVDQEDRTYQVLDGSYSIDDRVLRQSFSTTVFMPNRSASSS